MRLARDSRGGIGIMTGAAVSLGIGCLAFAVDLGSLYFESRKLQGMADAAALSAAGNLGDPNTAARAAISANSPGAPVALTLSLGTYSADPARTVAARFTPGAGQVNAARVTLAQPAKLFFGVAALGRQTMMIERSATATRADLASFSIGSRLAALDGGIANALLGGLTGSKVSLSAMDYNALLAADIDLFAYSDALRSELGLGAASFDRALAADIAPPRALATLATILDREQAAAAAGAVRKIAAGTLRNAPVQLNRLIDLGPIGAQDHAARGQAIRINAFDMLRSTLELANAGRQVSLDLGASIPGLTKASVTLAVGDRVATSPWLTVTARGDPVIRTAQTRLYVDAQVLPGGLGFGVASIRMPVYVELAEAEARLASVRCDQAGGTRAVTLDVRPAIGHAAIADVSPAALANHRVAVVESPAKLVAVPLLSVSGTARVNLTAPVWKTVSFDAAAIDARAWRSGSSDTLAQGIVGSLVSKLSLTINVVGLGLGTGGIGTLIGGALTPAAPVLDTLVNGLTGLLGVHLGQADVRVNGVRCGQAALVA